VTPRETGVIRGYHAHVYFDASTREVAAALRAELGARFPVQLGDVHDEAYGPHPLPMFHVAFGPDALGAIVPWLMLNRGGLDILVHPNTDDPVADHSSNPLWLGTPVALDVGFIEELVAEREASVRRV
jgi:aromatic ring-cleaving dioxygenase